MQVRVKPSDNLKELVLLYVEDDESIREVFLMLIKKYFKKIYVANDGKEGVKIFKENADEIDLIISDVRMPHMDGLEMAKQIKEINYDVPLIFVTAFGDNNYLKDAIEVGADGYIIKPVDRNKLFSKLNSLANFLIIKKQNEEYVKLIETLFNNHTNGIILLDKNLNIKVCNTTLRNLLEKTDIKSPKTIEDILPYCSDENGKAIELDRLLHSNKVICYHKNGIVKYFDIDIQKIESYTLLTFIDITEYKLETQQIEENAMKDELTGLYNRKKLDEIEYNSDLCIIMFDIDDFKKINDNYGHLKGDEVLGTLANVIRTNVRETDILVRWGGEEFLIILENLKDNEIARSLAEKLRIKINQIEIEKVRYFSCSFGVSCGRVQSRQDFELLLSKADKGLYQAKRNGKNRVEVII